MATKRYFFFNIEDVFLLNDDPDYSDRLNGLFIIGNDNCSSLYVFDPHNNWGKGQMALFRLDSTAIKRSNSEFLGSNIREVLTKVNDGISFSKLPTLKDEV